MLGDVRLDDGSGEDRDRVGAAIGGRAWGGRVGGGGGDRCDGIDAHTYMTRIRRAEWDTSALFVDRHAQAKSKADDLLGVVTWAIQFGWTFHGVVTGSGTASPWIEFAMYANSSTYGLARPMLLNGRAPQPGGKAWSQMRSMVLPTVQGQMVEVQGWEQLAKLRDAIQRTAREAGIGFAFDPASDPRLRDYLVGGTVGGLEGAAAGALLGGAAGALLGNTAAGVAIGTGLGLAIGVSSGIENVDAGWRVRVAWGPAGVPQALVTRLADGEIE